VVKPLPKPLPDGAGEGVVVRAARCLRIGEGRGLVKMLRMGRLKTFVLGADGVKVNGLPVGVLEGPFLGLALCAAERKEVEVLWRFASGAIVAVLRGFGRGELVVWVGVEVLRRRCSRGDGRGGCYRIPESN
jgi:hypothetical protein